MENHISHGALREIMERALRGDFEKGEFEYERQVSTAPRIITWPEEVEFNSSYTLSGVRLGDMIGDLYLRRRDNDQRLDLRIDGWNDTAIEFRTKDPVDGVPFNCQAYLVLARPDGEKTSRSTKIVPRTTIYLGVAEHSDKRDDLSWYDYLRPSLYEETLERTVVIDSPELPEHWEIFESPHFEHPGLLIKYNSGLNPYFDDEKGEASYVSGPTYSPSENKLSATILIEDDWYWNYTVSAEFYILVPIGFPVPVGWRILGS